MMRTYTLQDSMERARRRSFVEGFRKSRKGNLWRKYDERTLTVFRSGEDYRWCLAGECGPSFSSGTFETPHDGLDGLWFELTEGGL